MSRFPLPSWRHRTAAIAATGALAVIAAGLVAPTGAAGVTIGAGSSRNLNLLGAPAGLDDVDARIGSVPPTATQLSAVSALGASARWNRFGTRAGETFPTPIQHVVWIFQENHSFDNVLGAYCVNNDTLLPMPRAHCNGSIGNVQLSDGATAVNYQAPDIVPSVSHSNADYKAAYNGGRMNGWQNVGGCAASAPSQYPCVNHYAPDQIPNLATFATAGVVADAVFQPNGGSTFGAHVVTATGGYLDGFTGGDPSKLEPGYATHNGWGCDAHRLAPWRSSSTNPVQWVQSCIPDRSGQGPDDPTSPVKYTPTFFDHLDAAGRSWRLYTMPPQATGPYTLATCPIFYECANGPQAANMVPGEQVITDAQTGTLPNYSMVLPVQATAAEGAGNTSQHNAQSMLTGDNHIGNVVRAIQTGPDGPSTTIFITYDDCGCFYDHVTPPHSWMGFRVPTVIVSPYAKVGYTDSTRTTYMGVMGYAESVLGVSSMGNRDRTDYRFSGSFDYTQPPHLGAATAVQQLLPAGERSLIGQGEDPDDPT